MQVLQPRTYLSAERPCYLAAWRRQGGFPPHAHAFPELVLITGGSGSQVRAGGEDRLASGDVLLLRTGDWHAYRHSGTLSGIDCAFDPDLLRRELAWTAADPRLGPLLWGQRPHAARRLRPAQPGRLAALFAPPPAGTGRAGWIGRLLAILDAVGGLLPPGAASAIHPAAAEAARLMDAQPASAWTLTGLGLRVGLRPAYLCRVFARDFGVPPRDWLLRRRVQLAQQQLIGSDLAITAIAHAAGWSDAGVFSRFFRRETGLSPRAWRTRFARPLASNAL